jgi:protein-disulfide isomerase
VNSTPPAESAEPPPRPISSRSTYLPALLAVAVIGVVVGLMVVRSHPDQGLSVRNQGYGPAHNPAVRVRLDSDGSQLLGLPGAVKTLDFYEDSLCPDCGEMETGYGQEIAQDVDQGKIAVRYHLLDFLNGRSSSPDYSTRAAAAFRCLAIAGNGPVYAKFHSLMFTTKRPSEGGADRTNRQLADLARSAGADPAAVRCVADGGQVRAAADAATAAGATLKAASGQIATPTVLSGTINVNLDDEDWVAKLAV